MIDKTAISEVLTYISKEKKLELYDFHKKFNLTPSEILNAVTYLFDHCVIELEGKNVSLKNEIPHDQILELRKLLFDRGFSLNDSFGKLENDVSLNVNQFYLPDENLLDLALKP